MASSAPPKRSRHAKVLIMQNSVTESFRFRMQIKLQNKVVSTELVLSLCQLLLTVLRRMFNNHCLIS